jgi:hypothetical protein
MQLCVLLLRSSAVALAGLGAAGRVQCQGAPPPCQGRKTGFLSFLLPQHSMAFRATASGCHDLSVLQAPWPSVRLSLPSTLAVVTAASANAAMS